MTIALEHFVFEALKKVSSFGIHLYKNKSMVEQNAPHMATGAPFRNFQWVKHFKLARCAQPGYDGMHDTVQHITNEQLAFLRKHNFKRIISLNQQPMHPDSVQQLKLYGIRVTQIRIRDFCGIGVANLQMVVSDIEACGQASLIYCGYGEGRTGTAVAAWAVKQIVLKDKMFFSKFDWIKLGFFLSEGFGSEKSVQFKDVGEYLKTLAPPPVKVGRVKRSLGILNQKHIGDLHRTPVSDVWQEYMAQETLGKATFHDAALILQTRNRIKQFDNNDDDIEVVYANAALHASILGELRSLAGYKGGINKIESDLKKKFDSNLKKIEGKLVQFNPPPPPPPENTKNFWDDFEDYEPDANFDSGNDNMTIWSDTQNFGLLAFD